MILMGSMLDGGVRRREPAVGAQHPDPTARGPHDPETRCARPTFSTKLLASIRAQKNAILSPDDEPSKEYADGIADARSPKSAPAWSKLKGLVAADRVEGQVGGASRRSARRSTPSQKVNNETLDLAVQNTNVKAKRLLKGDLQRQINILAAHLQKWFAAATSKPNADAAEVARLKTLVRGPRGAARRCTPNIDQAHRFLQQRRRWPRRRRSSRACRSRSRPGWRRAPRANRPARSSAAPPWPT